MAGYTNQIIIGGVKFGLNTAGLESFDRSRTYRWPEQARIARPQALQFVGAGEDTISIKGYTHPHFKGWATMDQIANLANEGKPQMVVSGAGEVFGRYVITDIKETRGSLMDDLRPRRMDFSMTLKKYGQDG